jgi:hypothetical protein
MKGWLAFVIGISAFNASDYAAGDDEAKSSFSELPASESQDIEVDVETIRTVWNEFKAALASGNLELAVTFFSRSSRERHKALLERMGSSLTEWPSTWSELTPIDIGDEVALFAFFQNEDGEKKVYSVVFVREPGYGWRIQQL